jgi:hypothetical protein
MRARCPPSPARQAGTPQPRRAPRPGDIPARRCLGLAGPGASGPRRPAQLCHPGHACTRRHPAATPGAVNRRQRAKAGGTRIALPQSPALSGLLAVSHKARTQHGALDGHDGVLGGVCGLRVSHAPSAHGPRGDVARSKGETDPDPHGALGLPLLCGDACAPHPGAVGPPRVASHRGAPVAAQAAWEGV